MSDVPSISNEAWFVKYKPTTLDEYIFSEEPHRTSVEQWMSNGAIDGNLLLYGSHGLGKTSLAHLLIRGLIKTDYDLVKIKSRSVKEIDELYSWCQAKPGQSKKKIVYIEEFDKLSATALSTMKDTLLENFQNTVSFICNTNFIHRIDPALISRFNYQFYVRPNKEAYLTKIKHILDSESIHYNVSDLENYIENNYTRGLRDIISYIQSASKSNVLDLNIQMYESIEDSLVNHTVAIFNIVTKIPRTQSRMLLRSDPLNSPIKAHYSFIIDSKFNPDVDWNLVLERLGEKVHFLPVKRLISEYSEKFDRGRVFPHLTYVGFLDESLRTIMEIC